ncbi:hypothetical protein EDD11_004343 [Mortierella claussenii]|nr:hypothetical protein EDD11_004343 [Mortierella claussenii]
MSSSLSQPPQQPAHSQSASTEPNEKQQQQQHQETKPVLTLPAPGDVDNSTNQLEVNGKDLKLDILGPVVVNEDGSMSRIDNWHEMAEIEKANVRRILLKRNAQRLERLRAEQKKQQEQAQDA